MAGAHKILLCHCDMKAIKAFPILMWSMVHKEIEV
jgi:hypothetical protein